MKGNDGGLNKLGDTAVRLFISYPESCDGRTFPVAASQEWGVLPLQMRKEESLSILENCFGKLFLKIGSLVIILLYKYRYFIVL